MGNYWIEKSERENFNFDGQGQAVRCCDVSWDSESKTFYINVELSEKQIEQIYTYMKEKPGL